MRLGIVDTALVVPVNLVALTDDVDFKSPETSIAYDAAGMELVWHFETAAGVVTHTAVTPTSGGVHDWINDGGAMYSVEIPASGGTVNNDDEGIGYFTGKADGVLRWRGPDVLIGSANAIGAKFGLDRPEVDVKEWNSAAVATPATAGYPVVTHKVGTGTGEINLTGGKTPATIAAGDLANNSITTASIADGAFTGAKFASDYLTAIASAVWNALTSGMTTASSIGKKLADWVIGTAQTGDAYAVVNDGTHGNAALKLAIDDIPDAEENAAAMEAAILDEGDATALLAAIAAKVEEFLINEGDATATVAAIATACNLAIVAGTVGTNVAAIKGKTDALPASPAATGDIPTTGQIADAVWDEATEGHTTEGTFGAQAKTVLDDLPTNEELGTALDGLEIPTADDNADAMRVEFGEELATLVKLETTLESDGETENFRFTEGALAQAPTGGGGGGGDCPDETTIANAVAAKITTDHGEGSYVRNTEPDNAAAQAAATAAAAVKIVTDRLNTTIELDGEVYRFTANALEAAPAGEAAAAVFWAYGQRTLTTPVASIVAAVRGSRITATRFVALGISLTGLGNIEDRQKLFFTAKGREYADEHDDLSAIQIEETAGLLRIAGAAADDATAGALEVDNATTGAITIALTGEATGLLSQLVGGAWDVKLITAAGTERQLTVGRFDVETAVTRATAPAEEE